MQKKRKYTLMIILLSLMSFSTITDNSILRLSKIEQNRYSRSTVHNTITNFYYSNEKIDSITNILTESKHKDYPIKEVYKYKYSPNTVEVYVESHYFPTSTKMSGYEFDSLGRISKYTGYGETKILLTKNFTYDKKSIKVTAIERYPEIYQRDTFKNISETIYFLNKSQNIDKTCKYYLDENNKMQLHYVRKCKYDNSPNPHKSLLFHSISERYFNSNNIISYQYNYSNNKNPRSWSTNTYEYDLKGRLKKEFDDDMFESDSIVQVYHYLSYQNN